MAHNSLPVPFLPRFASTLPHSSTASRPWIYLQLLSVDTPLIAVAWQLVLARAFNLQVSTASVTVLALCVWIIYALDHLLDVRKGARYSDRHEFAWHHRKRFGFFLATGLLTASALVLELPWRIFLAGIAIGVAVMLYLAAVHLHAAWKQLFPKEAAVALLFAAGSSVAVWSSSGIALRALPVLAAFAILCLINCCMVDVRESRVSPRRTTAPHPLTQWLGRPVVACTATLFVAGFSMIALHQANVHLRLALVGTSAALFVLSCSRRQFSPDVFRFAADISLLLPALLALL